MAFSEQVRLQALLWSDRHCCLCKKACGTNIEVHHIIPEADGGYNDINNALPLCFDCHSDVCRYNDQHPRGSKYKPKELKVRREQVYEEFTRHLVPPVEAQITQRLLGSSNKTLEFPDVGFTLQHHGDSLPVRVKVVAEIITSGKPIPLEFDYYSGKKFWNLNPRFIFHGHFIFPEEVIAPDESIELRVTITIIDQYDREHRMLPVGFIYVRETNYWYAEP